MKLNGKSTLQLHPLYHRKEGDQYIVGNPETGEFMYVTPAELRAIQLVNARLTLRQIDELLKKEKVTVDLHELIRELREKRFIHRVDTKVITPAHEPLHEFRLPVAWLGSPAARFVYLLLSLWGVFTLALFGTFPSFRSFFFTEQLSLVLVSLIVVAWLFIFVRQLVKYAACLSLGVPCKFGFANSYHAFLPKVYHSHVSDDQEHAITGTSLLGLTAFTSAALLLAVYVNHPYNTLWQLVFAIGVLEILAECLLFMDTDLSRFISLSTNVHKLNKQTAAVVKEDFKMLFKGRGAESHPVVTRYAFFYMLSVLLAVLLLLAYVVPAAIHFIVLALQHFSPGDALFFDSFLALAFLSMNLLLYGFALLRHHPLGHNTLFVDVSLIAVVLGTAVVAVLGVQLFSMSSDPLLGALLTFGLGIVVATLFESAVHLAKPFVDQHNIFETVLLPIVAATLPLLVLFAVPGILYSAALTLGVGMLIAVIMSHFSRRSVA